MTLQEIFDKVTTHLLTQNACSTASALASDPGCAYRGENGRSCAVGCLIPDNLYAYALEGRGVISPPVASVLQAAGVIGPYSLNQGQADSDEIRLLQKLQHVHDAVDPGNWPRKLKALAASRRLQYNPPKA